MVIQQVKTASNAEDVGSLGRELDPHATHYWQKKTKPLKVHVTKSIDNLGETEKKMLKMLLLGPLMEMTHVFLDVRERQSYLQNAKTLG